MTNPSTARGTAGPKRTDSPTFLTVADVAARWQVSSQFVRKLIDHRELPVHRLGRAVRVKLADVVTFEDSHGPEAAR